ncbi:triose-phosphate isomerase [Oleiagrimonas sp.]|uniref:triose-phosphate isomerase n=1 Tax=Oleiagrimonas sp. TaxID=2010330 RepID=UPI0026227139|nr:triose-phosphate isomerase [Oleiagrimonas sp.]MDA3914605.1 triose-phosphate isomerase [Oleiagrimonas sp.]
MRRKLVAGNWKMHGTRDMALSLVRDIAAKQPDGTEVVVFPPFPYLDPLIRAHGDVLGFGGQDVSEHDQPGAWTGEISAAMLEDIGCAWALVGHSERRQHHHEGNAQVAAKFAAARQAGLLPMLCVGETKEQRDAGCTEAVLTEQLSAVIEAAGIEAFRDAVVAYEPIWAIGTGTTATPEQVQQAHSFIRSLLAAGDAKISGLTRVLYGGSVKPANAAVLFAQADVDGGLIGGASLTADDFLAICAAAQSCA